MKTRLVRALQGVLEGIMFGIFMIGIVSVMFLFWRMGGGIW